MQGQRRKEIEEFWQTAPEFMRRLGIDEDELLRRFPSMRGTKPEAASGCVTLVSIGPRDWKTAAAGDRDDAA